MGNLLKKTKIVATLGPASSSPEIILKLMQHGLNVARLNFSHGTHAIHAQTIKTIRTLEKEQQTHIAIMQDLQGPKIRLGNLAVEGRVLESHQEITLVHAENQIDEAIPVQFNIFPFIQTGHAIYINDGTIKLYVKNTTKNSAICTVVHGGEIRSHKGVNIPDTTLPTVSLTEKDKIDLKMGIKEKVDYVAISFVQNDQDIHMLKNIIATHTHKPKIIVKIETKAAIKNLEQIIQATDGVMIARGDLAVEVSQEEVPLLQRSIIRLTKKYNKPVIVATQMLESMTHCTEPTRAEVNDVATAVLDQVDAVMLSGETASGQYPVETVSMMHKIITHVEHAYTQDDAPHTHIVGNDAKEQTNAIAAAASLLAHQLDVTCIFALTATGNTPLKLSSYRPEAPIIALCDSLLVAQQLCLVWGVTAHFQETITDNAKAFALLSKKLQTTEQLKTNDRIVMVTGTHPGVSGNTNSISVTKV